MDSMKRHGLLFAAALALLLVRPAPACAISFFTPVYKKEAATCAEALEKKNFSAAIAAGQQAVEAKGDYFESRHCLGRAYAGAGMTAKAMEQLRAALPLADTPNQTMVLNSDLGQLLQKEKDYVKALERYDTALAYAIVTQDMRTRGLTLANMASLFRERGEIEKALEYYRRAVDEGEVAAAGTALNNMGTILFDKKDYADALDAYSRAAVLGERLKNPLTAGIALLNTGNVLLAQLDFAGAEAKLTQGLAKIKSAKDGYWEAAANEYFGRLYIALGDTAKAKVSFTTARDGYRANRYEYEAQQMELRLRELDAAPPASAPPGGVTVEPLPR